MNIQAINFGLVLTMDIKLKIVKLSKDDLIVKLKKDRHSLKLQNKALLNENNDLKEQIEIIKQQTKYIYENSQKYLQFKELMKEILQDD